MSEADKSQDQVFRELAELRRQVVAAEEARQRVVRREEAMGRMRDQLMAIQHQAELLPWLEENWIEELSALDIPVHRLSLRLPAAQEGYFVDYSAGVDSPAESAQHLLADYPWVREAWERGEPVVGREETAGVQSLLEVPLPGEGSLGVSSAVADVFDDEAIRTVQTFAGLIAEGLRRVQDFEALRQSEDRLRLALEAAQMGSWEWDLQTGEIAWSDNFDPLLGLAPGSFGGRSQNFLAQVHAEDREVLVRSINRTLEEGADYEIEFRLVWSDQTIRWARAQGRVFFDHTGRALRMVGVVMDITQHRLLEDQLRHAQRLETVGRLAGGVAHDFNNLLTVITGYSDLLLSSLGPDDPLRRELGEIKKAGNQAALLTARLLAFSRKQVVQPKVLNLNAVTINVEKMLRSLIGEDIEVITVAGEDLGNVKADPGQIEQIIMNLAVNARDAMPQGGKLRVETANVDLDETYSLWHANVRPGAYVSLAVSDTGSGMDQETLSHIFEPFFTTKAPDRGTGLGLSTVYGIVEHYNGGIEVDSEPGEGTVFRLYLPRVEEAVESAEEEESLAELDRGSEIILLVEDEDEVRKLARRVLVDRGYTLLEAGNGEEALLVCDAHQDSIDLMVADVVMPGMGGGELAERLSILRPQMKVLYISGYTDDAIVHHGVLESGKAFLQKPFTPTALARKVREVLDNG